MQKRRQIILSPFYFLPFIYARFYLYRFAANASSPSEPGRSG